MKALTSLSAAAMALLFLSASCNSGKDISSENTIGILDIENAITENLTALNLSRYASSIKYIPLETGDGFPVGDVNFFRSDGRNFYLSSRLEMNIEIFSSAGKYVGTIERQGRGPGEYLGVNGFFIYADAGKTGIGVIDIYDKVQVYDSAGIFVRTLPGANYMEYAGNGRYLGISDEHDNETEPRIEELFVTDTSGNILYESELWNIYKRKVDVAPLGGEITLIKDGALYTAAGSIRIADSSMDTIYTVNEDFSLIPEYVFDYGKYIDMKEKVYNMSDIIHTDTRKIMETEPFLLFWLDLPKKSFRMYKSSDELIPRYITALFVYDKAEKRLYALRQDRDMSIGFTNDLDGGGTFSPMFVTDDKMYEIVDAIAFMERAEASGSAGMKQIAAQLTENSNPVIVEVTLK